MKLWNRYTNRACPDDGLLRLAVDTGVERFPEVASHLTTCERCQHRFKALGRDAAFADQKLGMLDHDDVSPNTRLAYQAMQRRITIDGVMKPPQGETFMSSMMNTRAARGAVAMAALVLLTAVFALTPMRSVASNLFNRFEVQEFQAITIRPDQFQEFGAEMLVRGFGADLERVADAAQNLAELETSFDMESADAVVQEFETYEAASAAFGEFRVPGTVPAGFEQDPSYTMTEASWIRATVNTESLNTILDELGFNFDSIPDASEMPELTATLDIPSALVTHYQGSDGQELAVIQLESPVLTTPEGLDMNAVRSDLLSLPGLPGEFVDQVKAIDNWESTLIVPVPEGAETRNVTIDGQPALLIEAGEFDTSNWGHEFQMDGEASVVMWNDDGVLYIVVGSMSGDQLLDVANSLQ